MDTRRFSVPIMDFTNPTDTPQYPQAWYSALSWELAKQSAPMFNKQWSQNSEENRREAIAIAREQFPATDTLYFQPGREDSFRNT